MKKAFGTSLRVCKVSGGYIAECTVITLNERMNDDNYNRVEIFGHHQSDVMPYPGQAKYNFYQTFNKSCKNEYGEIYNLEFNNPPQFCNETI
jgi:hypothetical protein